MGSKCLGLNASSATEMLYDLRVPWKQIKGNQMRTSKHYSELAIARKSAIKMCVFTESQGQAEEWETIVGGQREGSRCSLIGGCWLIKRGVSRCLAPSVGLKVEVGTKFRETVTY